MLTKYGKSWVNYRPDAGDQSQFKRYWHYRRRRASHHVRVLGRPLRRARSGVKRDLMCTSSLYPLGMAKYMVHIRGIDDFFDDAEAGMLPDFCIVDPDFGEYSEENPQDIRKGESFAAEVIHRVMHGKGWEDTLLIWTYDENGGYYDHVAPPAAEPPDDVRATALSRIPPGSAASSSRCFPATSSTPGPRLRAAPVRHVRLPGTGRDRLAVRPARLRAVGRLRPHIRAEARRGEVEPASADVPRRSGDRAARSA